VHARVCDHAGAMRRSRSAPHHVAFRTMLLRRHPEGDFFRGSMAGLHVPLPTLRRHPHGCPHTARGRCDSLRLHRNGIPPSTLCRSSRRTTLQIPSSELPASTEGYCVLRSAAPGCGFRVTAGRHDGRFPASELARRQGSAYFRVESRADLLLASRIVKVSLRRKAAPAGPAYTDACRAGGRTSM
jgi:hypothetical protein